MDPEAFLDLANQVTKLKMYPYFDAAHCIIVCLYMREDLGPGAIPFTRKHPLSCWVSCMFSVFAGSIFANLLLGEPVMTVFKNNNQIYIASLAWYFILYSPFDIAYKVAKFLPIKMVLSAMKEVHRCKKVHDGVAHAAKLYPNSYIIMVMIGTIKGNGGAFLKMFERLLRGVWTPQAMEILSPTFPTKAVLISSVIFILDKKTDYISAPHSLVYFGVVIFFVYFKLSSLLLGIHDPFLPFENMFCMLFLGGIWDALGRAMNKGGAEKGENKSSTAPDQKKKD